MDRISRISRDVLVQAGVLRGDRSRNEAVLFLALSEKAVGHNGARWMLVWREGQGWVDHGSKFEIPKRCGRSGDLIESGK